MKTYLVTKAFPGRKVGDEIQFEDAEGTNYVADGYVVMKDAHGVAQAESELDATADHLADLVLAKTMAKIGEKSKSGSPFNLTVPEDFASHAQAKDTGSLAEWLWAAAGQAQTLDRGKSEHCKNLLINKYTCKINENFGKEWLEASNRGAGGLGAVQKGLDQSVSKASVQVEGVGSLGGLTVPIQFSNEFFRLADPMSIFMSRVKRYTMVGKQLMIPALDYSLGGSGNSPYLGGMNATWTGENIGFSQQNAQVRQIELNANLLAGYTQSSRTLLADSAVALEQVMTGLFAQAIAFNVDYAIFKGDGINKPKGMTTSGAVKTFSRGSWASNGILLNDLAKADSYIIPELDGQAMWLVPPSFKQKLYPMTNAAGGVAFLPNFPPSPSGAAALRPTMSIFGKDLYFSQLPASSGTAGDVNLVIPSLYALGLRNEIEISVSEHYAFTTNLLTWRFLFRGDGASLLNTVLTLQNGDVVAPFVSII